jgi:hypothetical protein
MSETTGIQQPSIQSTPSTQSALSTRSTPSAPSTQSTQSAPSTQSTQSAQSIVSQFRYYSELEYDTDDEDCVSSWADGYEW